MRLLIGYDGSECADAALDDLRRAGLPGEAEVLLFSVAETWLMPSAGLEVVTAEIADQYERRVEELRQRLGMARERLLGHFPQWEVEVAVGTGSVGSTILRRAEEWSADMVVVGSHGYSGIRKLLLGSVSQRIASSAHCSVRIARGRLEENGESPERLVVGLDGSIDSDIAVYVVAHRRWSASAEVRLVTSVGPLDGARTVVEEKAAIERLHAHAAGILESEGLTVSSVISFEDPRHAIITEAESWGADAIFIGSHGAGQGRQWLGQFMLGSVSTAIAGRAHCSVEIVRRASTSIWPADENVIEG